MDGHFLFSIIQSIVFLIPIATLIWKFAKMHSKIEKTEEFTKLAHERIDKYANKYELKAEELLAQIQNVRDVMIRLEEKLNCFLKEKEHTRTK